MKSNTDPVLRAYLTCALWSSIGDDGEPLDDVYEIDDIAAESIASAASDVCGFLSLCDEEGINPFEELDPEQVGHDLWLTRNRHGAGFWDRGIGESGRKLTELAKTYGTSDAYVGDDGYVYLT
jgi:hypothetical protein